MAWGGGVGNRFLWEGSSCEVLLPPSFLAWPCLQILGCGKGLEAVFERISAGLALFGSLCNKRQLSHKNKFDKLSGMFSALVLSHFEPETSHNARFWGPNTLVF